MTGDQRWMRKGVCSDMMAEILLRPIEVGELNDEGGE